MRRKGLYLAASLCAVLGCYRTDGPHSYHKVKADITAIEQAAAEYALQNGGAYPERLEALTAPDETGFTYLNRDAVPLDPWGHPYGYEPPAEKGGLPRVYTRGSDGAPGGKGAARDVDNRTIRNREI